MHYSKLLNENKVRVITISFRCPNIRYAEIKKGNNHSPIYIQFSKKETIPKIGNNPDPTDMSYWFPADPNDKTNVNIPHKSSNILTTATPFTNIINNQYLKKGETYEKTFTFQNGDELRWLRFINNGDDSGNIEDIYITINCVRTKLDFRYEVGNSADSTKIG